MATNPAWLPCSEVATGGGVAAGAGVRVAEVLAGCGATFDCADAIIGAGGSQGLRFLEGCRQLGRGSPSSLAIRLCWRPDGGLVPSGCTYHRILPLK